MLCLLGSAPIALRRELSDPTKAIAANAGTRHIAVCPRPSTQLPPAEATTPKIRTASHRDMASHDQLGIGLSMARIQEQCMLLELPPEVLELLAAPNPPTLVFTRPRMAA